MSPVWVNSRFNTPGTEYLRICVPVTYCQGFDMLSLCGVLQLLLFGHTSDVTPWDPRAEVARVWIFFEGIISPLTIHPVHKGPVCAFRRGSPDKILIMCCAKWRNETEVTWF